MEQFILVMLGVNLVLTIVYAACCTGKKNRIWLTLFFLAIPIMGFLLYFVPGWFAGKNREIAYNREKLVRKSQVVQLQKTPDINKELDIIPIEDAMLVSSSGEKRSLLLEQLKKGPDADYKLPLPTGEDSQAAHYVATAKMEIYRQKHARLLKVQEKVQKNSADKAVLREYLSGLEDYIQSGVLEEKEAAIYREEYCNYFMKLHKVDADGIDATEVTCYLDNLISLGATQDAEDLWKVCPEEKKNEEGYRLMLGMYYNKKEKMKFFRCLKELEESTISLSSEGLMLLRFWIARREA